MPETEPVAEGSRGEPSTRVFLLVLTGASPVLAVALHVFATRHGCSTGTARLVQLCLVGAALAYALGYPVVAVVRAIRLGTPTLPFPTGSLRLVWWMALATAAVGLWSMGAAPGLMQRSRIAQAEAGVRELAVAVSTYASHVGALPPTLRALTAATTNAKGETAGPFLHVLPPAPCDDWTDYGYAPAVDGTFSISTTSASDHWTAKFP